VVVPRRVHVKGPLAPYAAGFEEVLGRQGYRSATNHLYVMAQLSRWLFIEQLETADLTAAGLEDFARWRSTGGYISPMSSARMSRLVDYLVNNGVITRLGPVVPGTPAEVLIERYRCYLVEQRSMVAQSVRVYIDVARAFLLTLAAEGELDLQALTTAEVTRFVLAECQRCKVGSAKAMTTRLRSLLRFLYVEGLTTNPLAGAVPSVASWRLASLPRALPAAQLASLLKSCDRRKTVGRRDFAVLVLLSRLGLRAGEVARLQLGDFDWRAGEVVVRGKGGRTDRLPLPVDVGEAVVAWLQRGRPGSECLSVFVRVRAPHEAISSGGVSTIVRRASERAGLAPAGSHRLRHSAATDMLRAGGSLDEVGQVLRHRHRETTSIYAKVDRRSLSAVVRPWPGAKP
jgi:integrase/recombinase XerD